MAGKPESITNAKVAEQEGGEGRQRSTIGFPYMSLDDAITMANAIHMHVGHGDCDNDQLAAWLNVSSKSSSFRQQIYAARMFGVLQTNGAGQHSLTELGRQVVDAQQARGAKAKAFLQIPLYKKVFEKYKSGALPPAAAFERDIVAMGVAEKQKERARQVFERSAEEAGFFEQGKDRLVMPGVAVGREPPPPEDVTAEKPEVKSGGGSGGGGGLHPFIQGLLQSIPEPAKPMEDKTEWPVPDRVKWLQTAANIFDLIYKGEGGIEVRLAGAPRSPRPD